jgi:putative peptide zinc metalloprotease protein
LREELDLLPGPALPDGQPSWTLHDPVRNLFFQLDWASFEVLRRWDMADAQAMARYCGAHHLQVTAADVQVLQQFLLGNELLQPYAPCCACAGRKVAKPAWRLVAMAVAQLSVLPGAAAAPPLERWAPRLDFLFRPVSGG